MDSRKGLWYDSSVRGDAYEKRTLEMDACSDAGIRPAAVSGKSQFLFCRGGFRAADLPGMFGRIKPDKRACSVFRSGAAITGDAGVGCVFYRKVVRPADTGKTERGKPVSFGNIREVCAASGLLFIGSFVSVCFFLRNQL